ncbi:MAG: hypothetical protein ABIR59_07635 [Gemmatimonadales bacterium]
MSSFTPSTIGRLSAAALAFGLVACQGEPPTAADSPRTPIAFAIGDAPGDPTNSTPELGKLKVCKSASSNVSGTFTFSRTTTDPSTGSVLATATIAPNNCIVAAVDPGIGINGSAVTTTETSAGMTGVSAQRVDANNPTPINEPFANGGSLFINAFHGFTITYVNYVEPSTAINGCSPGYYKTHAFPTLPNGYTSSTSFATVFGNNVYGTKTLFQVLTTTGNDGLAALGRQTVAAYLNAVIYPDFGYTPDGVISAFNTAVNTGTAADQNDLKNIFEALTDVDGRICTNPTAKLGR